MATTIQNCPIARTIGLYSLCSSPSLTLCARSVTLGTRRGGGPEALVSLGRCRRWSMFSCGGAERIGEPTDTEETGQVDWVPLSSGWLSLRSELLLGEEPPQLRLVGRPGVLWRPGRCVLKHDRPVQMRVLTEGLDVALRGGRIVEPRHGQGLGRNELRAAKGTAVLRAVIACVGHGEPGRSEVVDHGLSCRAGGNAGGQDEEQQGKKSDWAHVVLNAQDRQRVTDSRDLMVAYRRAASSHQWVSGKFSNLGFCRT